MTYNINDNPIWFTQSMFFYKDKLFGSDSILDLSISSNSDNLRHFTSPNLLISIISDSDKTRKNCTLSFVDLIDLVLKIKQIQKDLVHSFQIGAEILCKYSNKKMLKISCKTSTNGENVVEIEIRHNESDFGKIYLPLNPTFLAFIKKLEIYTNTCDQLSTEIVNRYLLANLLDEMVNLRKENRVISDQMISSIRASTKNIIQSSSAEISEKVSGDSSSIPGAEVWEKSFEGGGEQIDFSNFMTNTISTVTIPEIDNIHNGEKKAVREINSILVNKILDTKIENLESIIYSVITDPNPLKKFTDIIQEKFPIVLMPDIVEDEFKSAVYITGLFLMFNIQNYVKNSVPLPTTSNIIKYKYNGSLGSERTELLYDLLTIGAYIRVVRSKLEDKETDATKNKAILYVAFRLLTDIFVFSFLDLVDKNTILSCISERFNIYKSKGFFKSFDDTVKLYNCTEVVEKDITSFVSIVIDSVMGKGETILELHTNFYNSKSVILPSINKLSLEQINELTRFEVEKNLGGTPKSDSQFIIDLLKQQNGKTEDKKQLAKEPNIYKLVYSYRNEIPESVREQFLNYLKDIDKNNVEWSYDNVSISEVGDNVIKAIYAWNESDKDGSYKDFVSNKFEQCLLTKELILTKIGNLPKSDKKNEESNWDDIEF